MQKDNLINDSEIQETSTQETSTLLELEKPSNTYILNLYDIENSINENTSNDVVNTDLEEYKAKAYEVIKELLDELDPHRRQDHFDLAVKTMRFLEIPDIDIKGWMNGNIIL